MPLHDIIAHAINSITWHSLISDHFQMEFDVNFFGKVTADF